MYNKFIKVILCIFSAVMLLLITFLFASAVFDHVFSGPDVITKICTQRIKYVASGPDWIIESYEPMTAKDFDPDLHCLRVRTVTVWDTVVVKGD